MALIPVGNLSSEVLEPLRQALATAWGHTVITSADLVHTRACTTQLLVASPGTATRQQLKMLRQDLHLQGSPLLGWILISGASTP
jgi:hypothetical protein